MDSPAWNLSLGRSETFGLRVSRLNHTATRLQVCLQVEYEFAEENVSSEAIIVATSEEFDTFWLSYRVSQKKVSAFGELWNKKYVTDSQN